MGRPVPFLILRVLAAFAALVLSTSVGQAGLHVCNKTEVTASVAIGTKSGDAWMSIGWWEIAPGNCQSVITDDLGSRYFYIKTSGDAFFDGDAAFEFCTSSDAFQITGNTDCEARGYRTERFVLIDAGPDTTDFSWDITGVEIDGEPFETEGKFTGCETKDSQLTCIVFADFLDYRAHDDGFTNDSVLDRLKTLVPGTSVAIAGRILAPGDGWLDVGIDDLVALNFESFGYIETAVVRTWRPDLQDSGLWRLASDGNSYVFTNGQWSLDGTFKVLAACPDGTPTTTTAVLLYVKAAAPEPQCLEILKVNERVMDLKDARSGKTYGYSHHAD